MKYTNLEQWKKAVEDQRYVVKQVHGYEQFEALDGDHVVGRWNAEHGYLGEAFPDTMGTGLIPESELRPSTAADEPWASGHVDTVTGGPVVTETNVTEVK